MNQIGFSWHVRNSLDSEVQVVMDELINNNRSALATTSTLTTPNEEADEKTTATTNEPTVTEEPIAVKADPDVDMQPEPPNEEVPQAAAV